MNGVLYLAHPAPDGSLPRAALEGLQAALESCDTDDTLTVGLLGDSVQAAADRLAGCGASRTLAVEGPEFGVSRYGSDVAAIAALVAAADVDVVLAPSTSRFARALPGAAQRCGGRVDTRVTGVRLEAGELEIERWYYRQRMVARLKRAHRPWFLLMAPGVFHPWAGTAGSAVVEHVAVEWSGSDARTRVEGTRTGGGSAQTVRQDADLLFVAGAGWSKRQADGRSRVAEVEKLILGFLDRTQASFGSSKSLVDLEAGGGEVMGFLTQMNQVGQTGSTPRHSKGLATCCHGEEPHVVGWRFVEERRAVNLDPDCGWAHGKADVLYVADAFEVMARVNELLGDK